MTGRTAWTPGNGVGLTWTTLINSADMVSMPNLDSVLSSVSDITNGTAFDMFMDVSVELAIASNTLPGGANLALYLYALLDGGGYGDGQLTAGTQSANLPAFSPAGIVALPANTVRTSLVGYVQQIVIPPGSFRFAIQNNSGFTLTSGTQTVKYRTYNLNLNN